MEARFGKFNYAKTKIKFDPNRIRDHLKAQLPNAANIDAEKCFSQNPFCMDIKEMRRPKRQSIIPAAVDIDASTSQQSEPIIIDCAEPQNNESVEKNQSDDEVITLDSDSDEEVMNSIDIKPNIELPAKQLFSLGFEQFNKTFDQTVCERDELLDEKKRLELEVKTKNDIIADFRSKIGLRGNTIEALQQKIEAHKRTIGTLQTDLASCGNELSSRDEQIIALELVVQDRDAIIEGLQADLVSCGNEMESELRSRDDKINSLEHKVGVLEGTINGQRVELKAGCDIIQKNKEDLMTMKARIMAAMNLPTI